MRASLASGMFLHENTKVKVTTIYTMQIPTKNCHGILEQ